MWKRGIFVQFLHVEAQHFRSITGIYVTSFSRKLALSLVVTIVHAENILYNTAEKSQI